MKENSHRTPPTRFAKKCISVATPYSTKQEDLHMTSWMRWYQNQIELSFFAAFKDGGFYTGLKKQDEADNVEHIKLDT